MFTKQTYWNFFYWLMGISLFFLPLIHAWMVYPLSIESFQTNYAALGGILPWSDANCYYKGANTLLETGFLDPWNMRRPLNAALFSVRLWLSNNNFQIALAIQAIWCSISCLLVTASIHRTFGKAASIITLFILFLFASVFIPTTLSETLGLTLGCLSFVIVWEAMKINRWWLFFTSGLILTIGLNARSGAFFILPLLIVWLSFRKNSKPFQFTIGIISGFICNFILIKLYSSGNIEAPHANFSQTLFGLVAGGKGWSYAYTLYPSMANQSETIFAKFLYNESFKLVKNNPFLLFQGIIKNYLEIIKPFTKIFQHSLIMTKCLMSIGILFIFYRLYSFAKLYKSYNNETKNKIHLINIALFSMFLSAGIIWNDGRYRVFAVTVPFLAAACGILLGAYPNNAIQSNNQDNNWETNAAIIFGYTLLILGVISPALIKSSNCQLISEFSCPLNTTKLMVKNISGSPRIAVPLQSKNFTKHLLKNPIENDDFLKLLQSNNTLTQPMFLGSLYDLNSATTNYILGPAKIFLNKSTCLGLCVKNIPEINNIMQIKSFKVLYEK